MSFVDAEPPPAGASPPASHWAYQRVVRPPAPPVKTAGWARNEIDAFVLSALEARGLAPAPEAPHEQLVRRLYFDLIGLPPTPAEVDRFLEDADPQAYEKLVDQLLRDPRHGERWARFWLDLARYADTAGYEGDPDLPQAWRYRDYVIDALNGDKPYDQFIREQIAGDEFEEIMGAGDLPEPKPEQLVALTFLRLAPFTEPRGDETRHEMLSEMTATVSSVFLGLTVGCAKCHDHKYDAIPTKDFYRLKAFFSTVQLPRPERGDPFQIGGTLPAEFYRPGTKEWAERQRAQFERAADEAKRGLEALTKALESKLASSAKISGSPASTHQPAARTPKLKDVLADPHHPALTEEDRAQYRSLQQSERFARQNLRRLQPQALSLRHAIGPPYEPGVPTSRVMIRGEYDNPGEVVEAGFLSCITGNQEPARIRLDPFKRWPTRSRRMALANWIASPDHPLTGRVMMNRLWHWHFGRGLVATPSDFGKLSGGPSHPQLLDWLADQFVQEKWSLRAMHRRIVTSATYRQTSVRDDPAARAVDPENTLLWRFRPRRLEAEAIRDSILAVSGRLNPESFGLPIFPPLPGDLAETVKFDSSKWETQTGPEGRRRSLYIYQQRTLTMPLMQAFDGLVCDDSRPTRANSVTPLQALAMCNGAFVNEESRFFARRVRTEAGPAPDRQIDHAFRLAFGRHASAAEIERLRALPGSADESEEWLTRVCHLLLNASEFVYVD